MGAAIYLMIIQQRYSRYSSYLSDDNIAEMAAHIISRSILCSYSYIQLYSYIQVDLFSHLSDDNITETAAHIVSRSTLCSQRLICSAFYLLMVQVCLPLQKLGVVIYLLNFMFQHKRRALKKIGFIHSLFFLPSDFQIQKIQIIQKIKKSRKSRNISIDCSEGRGGLKIPNRTLAVKSIKPNLFTFCHFAFDILII